MSPELLVTRKWAALRARRFLSGQTSPELYLELANWFFARGEFNEATIAYARVLRNDPNNLEAQFNLGRTLLKLEKVTEAVDSLMKSVQLNQSFPAARIELGRAFRRQGNTAAAITSLESAVELDPHHGFARLELGRTLMSAKRYRSAASHLKAATELCSSEQERLEALHYLAHTFLELSQFTDAAAVLREARKLSPDSLDLEFLAGYLRKKLDANIPITEAFTDFLTLEGRESTAGGSFRPSRKALENLAIRLFSTGESLFTSEVCDHLLLAYPESSTGYLLRGRAYLRLFKNLEALESLQHALQYEPTSIAIQHELGRAYRRCGRAREAELQFENILRQDRTYYPSLFELGRLYAADDKLVLAEQTLEQAVFHAPNPTALAAALLARAKVLRHRGATDKSLQILQSAVSVDRDNAELLHELGKGYLAKEQFFEAQNAFEEARAIAPERYENLLELYEISQKQGTTIESKELLSELLKRLRDAETALTLDPDALSNLGRAYFRLGMLDDAERVFRNGISRQPTLYLPHLGLAKLFKLRGQFRSAFLALNSATKLAPDDPGVKQLLNIVEGNIRFYDGKFRPTITPFYTPQNTEPQRVLHVLETSLPHRASGYGYRSHYVITAQQAMGYSVQATTRPGFPADSGVSQYDSMEKIHGIDYYRLPFTDAANYNRRPLDQYLQEYSEALAKVVSRFAPDIIHAASNFKNGVAACAVGAATGVPVVYELRGLWEDTQVSKDVITVDSDRYQAFRAAETRCLEDADAVVTISQTLRSEIIHRGIASDKIFVVPNAVDTEQFPIAETNLDLKHSLGLGENLVLGYISSIVAYEGIDVLLRAFALLHARNKNTRLLIVGEGDAKRSLEDLAHDLGIAEQVVFTGRIPHRQVLDYYSLIDIFVVPRLPYRVCEIVTPLKPYEAMSTGRAVVVSNVAALKEMIVEGDTGVSFRAGEHDDLARICEYLCSNQEFRTGLGKRAATWVRSHRTWKAVTETYRDVYKAAVANCSDIGPRVANSKYQG